MKLLPKYPEYFIGEHILVSNEFYFTEPCAFVCKITRVGRDLMQTDHTNNVVFKPDVLKKLTKQHNPEYFL